MRRVPAPAERSFVPEQVGHLQALSMAPHQVQLGRCTRSPLTKRTAAATAASRLPAVGAAQPGREARPADLDEHRAGFHVPPSPCARRSTGCAPVRPGGRRPSCSRSGSRAGAGVGRGRAVRTSRPRRAAPRRSCGCDPRSPSAPPCCSCRMSAASRAWTYGLSGSASSGSPSFQIAMSPSRSAGAYTAERVPSITSGHRRRPAAARDSGRGSAGGRPSGRWPRREQDLGQSGRHLVLIAVVGDDQDRRRSRCQRARRRGGERDRPAAGPRPARQAHHSRLDRERDTPPAVDRLLEGAGCVPGRNGDGVRGQRGSARPPPARPSRPAPAGSGSPAAGRRSPIRPPGRRRRARAATPPGAAPGSARRALRCRSAAPGSPAATRVSTTKPVRQPSGAAQRHGDPHTGHDTRHPVGDPVVEQPVELRQRRVDQHTGDRRRGHG